MTTDDQEPSAPKEESQEGSAKVSPEFQEQVASLLGEATLPELEFLNAETDDMMKKLQSSQKKSGLMTDKFSSEDMPKD